MGGGIAICFANAGIPVTLVDANNAALERGLANVDRVYQSMVDRGRLTADEKAQRMARIRTTLDYEQLRDADVIVEAVFESMDLKRDVFAKLDAVARRGAVLATNTSTLDIEAIAVATSRPQDVIGMHFFSPANVMPLLEVVRTERTSPVAIKTVMELAKPLRKTPVLASVCYGFIGNRMMEGYAREAQRMVLEGASPRQVDGALEDWGMAMGILAVFDMAGVDVGVNVHRANASRYPPDPSYYQADVALHEAGRLGQKSGKGYYRYEPGNRKRIDDPDAIEILRRRAVRAADSAACAHHQRNPGTLFVSADERRLPRSRRGRRAARGRHRRGLDVGVWVSALPRRADVPRGSPGPRNIVEWHASISRALRSNALGAGPFARGARRAQAEHRGVGARPEGEEGAVMNVQDLIAIDVHTHAEVSCRHEPDEVWKTFEDASAKYFKAGKRPTIPETIAYYRERKIGLVMFTVDSEFEIGARRIANEEVADAARENADIMMAFASIDPHKGKMGVREARRLLKDGVIRGFKFHPTLQGFFPNDRMAYPLYEVIAEHKLPAIFHSGHSGMGTGMPGGGGLRLKYSNPIHLDDVAADFPDMKIIIAHPSWPWQDEALSVCLHKPNVYIDLSGWSPKYFPPQLVQHANTQLKTRMLFGSDYPLITPDRWIKDFREAGFKPEVHDLILKQNAIRALGLDRV